MELEKAFEKMAKNQKNIKTKEQVKKEHFYATDMLVLAHIPRHQEDAIKQPMLRQKMGGMSARLIKESITRLREDYPICSKETRGGGYWIAETVDELNEFIYMIERRRNGYDATIKTMAKHKARFKDE